MIGWRCRQCLSPASQVAFFCLREEIRLVENRLESLNLTEKFLCNFSSLWVRGVHQW